MPVDSSISHNGPNGPISISFGEASQSQQRQCLKLAATSFHGVLSEADYMEREEYLASRPLTQNNGLRYWCLYLEKNPAQILATCKTISRDILVRDTDGIRQQRGYCIASVVTAPQFRKYGLASLLLERVAKWMDGPGDASASMLYTSIGDFYVRRGWTKIPALKSTLFPPVDFQSQEWPNRPSTRPLDGKDIPGLCERDVENIKSNFQQQIVGTNETVMAVLPSANLISWQHDRGDFTSLKTNGKFPESHGAICESGDSWLYWHHEFKKQALGIQRVRTPSANPAKSIEILASLLFDALEEANSWKLLEVFVWNASAELLEAMRYLQERFGVDVETKEQTGSVTSVRWRASDQTRDLKLQVNEHYAWS